MLYIENEDGTPITGTVAAAMRSFARSIWQELYDKNAAPEKWGDAPKDVREKYHYKMETEFYPLRLCDNHWKAHKIATTIYSQWYLRVVKKHEPVKGEDDSDEEPAAKRLKIDPTPEPASSHNDATCLTTRSTLKAIRPIDPL